MGSQPCSTNRVHSRYYSHNQVLPGRTVLSIGQHCCANASLPPFLELECDPAGSTMTLGCMLDSGINLRTDPDAVFIIKLRW